MVSRVGHRGAVLPNLKKTAKNPKFSLNGHEKPHLNFKSHHAGVKFASQIAIYVLSTEIS